MDVDELSDLDSDLTDSEDETDVNSSRIAELGSICDERSILSDVTALSEAKAESGRNDSSPDDAAPDSSSDEPQAKRQKLADVQLVRAS